MGKKDCRQCTHPGKDCIPYLMTMPTADLLEWCRVRKQALHLSYDELSAQSGVPQSTLERIMGTRGADCRFATLQPIIRVLSGVAEESLDCCHNAKTDQSLKETIEHQAQTIKMLQEENERSTETIEYMRKQEKRKNRVISVLSIALGVFALAVIAALVVDKLNTSIGFFWLNR